jgi:hypothetical protein
MGRQRVGGKHGYHALAGLQCVFNSAVPALPAENIQLIQP